MAGRECFLHGTTVEETALCYLLSPVPPRPPPLFQWQEVTIGGESETMSLCLLSQMWLHLRVAFCQRPLALRSPLWDAGCRLAALTVTSS